MRFFFLQYLNIFACLERSGTWSITIDLRASNMVGTEWDFLLTLMAFAMTPLKDLNVSESIVLPKNIMGVFTSMKDPPEVK